MGPSVCLRPDKGGLSLAGQGRMCAPGKERHCGDCSLQNLRPRILKPQLKTALAGIPRATETSDESKETCVPETAFLWFSSRWLPLAGGKVNSPTEAQKGKCTHVRVFRQADPAGGVWSLLCFLALGDSPHKPDPCLGLGHCDELGRGPVLHLDGCTPLPNCGSWPCVLWPQPFMPSFLSTFLCIC